MKTPSTEVALYSTQLLCENVIHDHGTHRDSSQGVLRDADWETTDYDGEELKLRLIQRRGLGDAALYTLRVDDSRRVHGSIYDFDALTDTLTQRAKLNGATTSSFELSPSSIRNLLASAYDNPAARREQWLK